MSPNVYKVTYTVTHGTYTGTCSNSIVVIEKQQPITPTPTPTVTATPEPTPEPTPEATPQENNENQESDT